MKKKKRFFTHAQRTRTFRFKDNHVEWQHKLQDVDGQVKTSRLARFRQITKSKL